MKLNLHGNFLFYFFLPHLYVVCVQMAEKRKACETSSSDVVAKKLAQDIEQYTTELSDTNTPDEYEDSELRKFERVNYRQYMSKGMMIIPTPKDKFQPYRMLTEHFGYAYNKTNSFLLDGGIYDILQLSRPFFSFWEHGLTVYLPRMDMDSNRLRNIMFKRSTCVKHKYRCGNNEDECDIREECESGASIKFFIAGTFRSYMSNSSGKKFTSYTIELDDCLRTESQDVSIANSISLNRKTQNIHILKKCKHENCGAGVENQAFDDMPPMRSVCGSIEHGTSFSDSMNNKRVYAFGKGITGSLHKVTRTIYLNTWNLTDLYVIDY